MTQMHVCAVALELGTLLAGALTAQGGYPPGD